MEEKVLHQPTQLDRLGQFAASHFVISFAGALLALTFGLLLVELIGDFDVFLNLAVVAAVVLMLAYGVAGVRAARVCGWSRPKHAGEGALAFLFPALIAWGWGSLVLCFSILSGPGWTSVGMVLLMVSFFAAFPSFLVVLTSHLPGFLDGGLLNMILCMLLAGGLPPLLFLLGSIWGSCKAEQQAMHAEEDQEENNGTE